MVYPAPKPGARGDVPNPSRGGLSSDLLWAWLYANRSRFGPLIERVLCCVTRAMELRAAIRQGKKIDRQFAESTYRQYASALAEFAADFAIHRCSFVSRADQLHNVAKNWKWDSPEYANDVQRINALQQKVVELDVTWLDIVSECLCSALLPACPQPAVTNCVPLAVVTLRPDDCRVLEICNWSQRKLLITWPNVSYWLSWLPWERLRHWISAICCGNERDGETLRMLTLLLGVVFSRAKYQDSVAAIPAARMMGAPVPAGAGAAGAAAGAPSAAPAGMPEPLEKALEADNLLDHILGGFEQLKAGAPGTAHEPAWARLIAKLTEPSALAVPIPGQDLAEMRRRVERAEQQLKNQEKEIARLKKKVRR
jgi:hypothetical protein